MSRYTPSPLPKTLLSCLEPSEDSRERGKTDHPTLVARKIGKKWSVLPRRPVFTHSYPAWHSCVPNTAHLRLFVYIYIYLLVYIYVSVNIVASVRVVVLSLVKLIHIRSADRHEFIEARTTLAKIESNLNTTQIVDLNDVISRADRHRSPGPTKRPRSRSIANAYSDPVCRSANLTRASQLNLFDVNLPRLPNDIRRTIYIHRGLGYNVNEAEIGRSCNELR